MRTVLYYSVCSISQIDQRCLINEENKQVCVGSTSRGNLQEKRDFNKMWGKGEGIGAVRRKDAWGKPGSCDYCTHTLRPWGLTRGSCRSPPVPAGAVLLLIPPQAKAAPRAHLSTAAPLLPNSHGPLPAIPPFRLSFPYIISLSSVKCYCHHYCSTCLPFFLS